LVHSYYLFYFLLAYIYNICILSFSAKDNLLSGSNSESVMFSIPPPLDPQPMPRNSNYAKRRGHHPLSPTLPIRHAHHP
jgi:hypothetical protein